MRGHAFPFLVLVGTFVVTAEIMTKLYKSIQINSGRDSKYQLRNWKASNICSECIVWWTFFLRTCKIKQECIPVGCVPPTAVAVGVGGLCLSTYWETDPPPSVGLETPPGQTPHLPPWVWAWKPTRHAGIPPPGTCCKACWDTTPPWTEWLIDRCKNITFTNFVCGR